MGESAAQQAADSLIKKDDKIFDISNFTKEEQRDIESISKQIDIEDSQAVVTFGVGAQRDIATFADSVLTEVRAKDTGYVGDILTDLVINVKDLNVDSLKPEGSFLSKIPIIGSLIDDVRRFLAKYENLSEKIDRIVNELDKARMTLLKDITLLDNMFDKNTDYLKKLDMYIAAGQIKLKEFNEKILPELKAKADSSKDAAEAQKYQDIAQAVNRFEKKLHDLKLSRIIAIQTSPQIRLIQNGDQTLVEKIQSSILNTIPLWKSQVVIAISIFRQHKALKLQKEVTETTNELLQKNAEMLKDGTIEVARESERGIVDIETLRKVNNDLITTLQETIKIQQDGRTKRQEAERELIKLEGDLKKKLTEFS